MAGINVLPGQYQPVTAESPFEQYRQSPPLKTSSTGSKVSQGKAVKRASRAGKGETSRQISARDKVDPAAYRHSVFHNICTSLLVEGYHKSYTELFTLVQQQRKEHEDAGPGAILLSPLIEHNHAHLAYLQNFLAQAELAQRSGDLHKVYAAQKGLAVYFEESGDRWLADHFHSCSLETGSMIQGDNRRSEGEAHFHVALGHENKGELSIAASHLEVFHQLARSHKWHTESGESLHRSACEHLRRVYTAMAEEAEPGPNEIELLQKALDIAKDGRHTYQEGQTSNRLGIAYEKIREFDKAIQFHTKYLERCRYHGDEVGVGYAYEALARCHESKGDLGNAVKCLELYVGVAEGGGAKEPLARACSAAGIMFNTLGEYSKAVEYFTRCHSLYQELDDHASLEVTRVHYGMALVHHKMATFTTSISHQHGGDLMQLMRWKAQRTPIGGTPLAATPTETQTNDSIHDNSIHDNSIHDDSTKSLSQETNSNNDT